jgi:plasmid maintenance system antidote protein VapI
VALEEWREGRRIPRQVLAVRLHLTERELAELITGRMELTLDLVLRLEAVTEIPRRMWAAMEAIYRSELAREINVLDD